MPKAFLLTHKRYEFYNLNIPRLWNSEQDEDDNIQAKKNCTTTKIIGDRNCDNFGQSINVNVNEVVSSSFTKIRTNLEENFTRANKKSNEKDREFIMVGENALDSEDDLEDQPVNLSVKKIDLFNLTQLAEVSLASSTSTTPSSSEENSEKDETLFRQICSLCGKAFSTLSNLARHRQTHRALDSAAVKKCPHCEKVYVSMPAFSMHLRTHNQGCKCTYCGKGFSRPWLLQGHIRTHTGEKPFKCLICGKAFADKSNLRAHTQTHSTEKPFICSRCGKTFALKSYLCKHIESSCMRSNHRGVVVGNGSTRNDICYLSSNSKSPSVVTSSASTSTCDESNSNSN